MYTPIHLRSILDDKRRFRDVYHPEYWAIARFSKVGFVVSILAEGFGYCACTWMTFVRTRCRCAIELFRRATLLSFSNRCSYLVDVVFCHMFIKFLSKKQSNTCL